MVKINRVYTRTGDDGRTMLGDGARLPKFHIRVAATGSVDEANAFIGWAARHVGEPARAMLRRVQNDLFDIGADLCRPERPGLKIEPLRLQETQVDCLEQQIDEHNGRLAPLTSFVLPGGSEASSLLHIARTIVRRAEREITELAFQEPITPAVIRYMNRLSDLLFVLARAENDTGASDVLWHPGAHRDVAPLPPGDP
ncbi:MAG TPA: cob(I)yrinic acid a,c-diamide adenosyltransferase [Stellaceae bacterium]|nr:cob(I)yrinic acid a,c-diamide adenosyltransferase [Stellaceae bacterium]